MKSPATASAASADIRLPTHAGHNPLPDVSTQVQHQVANRVFVRRAPCPDLIVVEPAQAVFDAGVKLAKLAHRVLQKQMGGGIHNQNYLALRMHSGGCTIAHQSI